MLGGPSPTSSRPRLRRRTRRAPAVLGGATQFDTPASSCARTARSWTLSFNASALRDGEGNLGITGTARDVTEQSGRRTRWPPKHRQMQAIIDNSPLVIYAKDATPATCLANRELEVQLSLPPGGASAKRDFDLLPEETAAERRQATGQRARLRAGARGGGAGWTWAARAPSCPTCSPCEATGRRLRGVRRRHRHHGAQGDARTISGPSSSGRCASARPSPRTGWCCTPSRSWTSPPGSRFSRSCWCACGARTARLIMPGEFLPPAERFRLAPQIDRWVIAQAAAAGQRPPGGGEPLGPEHRRRRTARSSSSSSSWRPGADPHNVVFEITETAAARGHRRRPRAWPSGCTRLGCGFALDDFGTGYGSFTYLKHLPVGYIKIDIDFVRHLKPDSAGPPGRERHHRRGPQLRHPDDRRGRGVRRRRSSCCGSWAPTTPRASTWAAPLRSTEQPDRDGRSGRRELRARGALGELLGHVAAGSAASPRWRGEV